MERFISSNPGLESRFGKYFHFEDYAGAELMDIFRLQCRKNQYEPDAEAEEFCIGMFDELYENRDENFGNARDVRNIFERAVSNVFSEPMVVMLKARLWALAESFRATV